MASRKALKYALVLKMLGLFFFASGPLYAHGAWIDKNGKPLPETESMRSSGNFGVQMILTPDDAQFRKTWNSTKGTPNLKSTDSVKPEGSIAAMLVFHGCAPNAAGNCDVVADFTLEDPTGVKTPAGGGPVWTGKPLPPRILQLGLASMNVGFDNSGPFGLYKVTARVTDRVSGRALSLTSKFTATR